MMVKKEIILLAFTLTSCTFGERKIKIFQIEEPREKLNLESPAPLTLDDLRWIIITSKNAEEVFQRLEAEGFDPVLFGLTDKDYEIIEGEKIYKNHAYTVVDYNPNTRTIFLSNPHNSKNTFRLSVHGFNKIFSAIRHNKINKL